jgi:tetratricopeptide (TPR) repeat protein
LKESFGKHFFSPSSLAYAEMEEWADEDDRESAKSFVPDNYDPCSCASGKKFKFCCKPGFSEIIGAMAAAESGYQNEANGHILKAKKILGETAEVLCREAIVQSYVDDRKAMKTLDQALGVNPNHPRANYIRGIDCKRRGDWNGAIAAYQVAIANYPKTDRYHLNECYNNLGTSYFEKGEFEQAKASWEQAFALLPSDKVVRENLREFIYENPALSEPVREISPFIQRIWKRR